MSTKILIVDDDKTNILVLKGILEKYHFETLSAKNGAVAVELFQDCRPDIVIMDLMMPVMDGYEATRKIKELAAQDFIPVIFLTAVTDEKALAKCVECGGDDFLTKPYNHIILKAKIDSMLRIKSLHETVTNQNKELSLHHQRINKEQVIAEKIFANIVSPGYQKHIGVHYHMSPLAVFNGDLLLFATRPTGGLHVLVGDFTGHGLSAAVGALPVSDIFYAMTSSGFSVGDIVQEINSKLHRVLPTELFFAATMIEVDNVTQSITIWSGGMPETMVVNKMGKISHRISPRYLPLGILPPNRFDRVCENYSIESDDRIYIFSDGVTEMSNISGEMLGDKGLEELILAHGSQHELFEEIVDELKYYAEGSVQADDITFVEVACSEKRYPEILDRKKMRFQEKEPMNWQLSLQLDHAMLNRFDPLPFLNKSIMEMQGMYHHKERVYTILSELISNAIDHGLLHLDSSLKVTPDGFSQYYSDRERKIAEQSSGWIAIDLEHEACGESGLLKVAIHDSGDGFDIDSVIGDLSDVDNKSGRGIPLVKALCESIKYSNNGRCVEVRFRWESAESPN